MGKRVQRIPSWPGVKRFTPTKAVYICADQLVTSSHFACGEAADHTFRLRRTPSRIDAKRGDHSLQADFHDRSLSRGQKLSRRASDARRSKTLSYSSSPLLPSPPW